MTTVALLGCGALARLFALHLSEVLPDVRLTGAFCRTTDVCQTFASRFGCRAAASLDELLADNPDYVIEFAGGGAVRAHARAVLEKTNLITASIGAFADPAFLEDLESVARAHGTRLFLPNGAVGGLDLLQTFALMGGARLEIENEKAPRSLNGAPYLAGRALSEAHPETVFTGSVQDAIAGFPKNVNVAVAASVAASAPDALVTIHSVPGAAENTHRIKIRNDLMHAELTIASKPDPANPKSSTSTAWSVLALLKNLTSSVVIF